MSTRLPLLRILSWYQRNDSQNELKLSGHIVFMAEVNPELPGKGYFCYLTDVPRGGDWSEQDAVLRSVLTANLRFGFRFLIFQS